MSKLLLVLFMSSISMFSLGCEKKEEKLPTPAIKPTQAVQSSAKKPTQAVQSSASKSASPAVDPLIRKQPKRDAKPEIKASIQKINQIMATSIYREPGSKEYSKYKVEYIGNCNIYVNQSFVPMRHGTFTDTRTDVDLKILQPIISDEWYVSLRALHDKPKFPVAYDEDRASESDSVDLYHAASKKTSGDIVKAIETIIKSDKCQTVSTASKINPKFHVTAEIVGDASVKFKVTTNIPGKVNVMMSYKIDKAISNYGKDFSDGHLTIENGVGEITLTGVGSGSKGTLYHKISPGHYVGELFFKPSWGLVDDVAKASKVNRDIKIEIPIKGTLKGQKEKFIPA